MVILDAILEKSYWLSALSCVGLGLFILLIIFVIFFKIFGNAIKNNLGIFIILILFFSGPLISLPILFLVFCGFAPAIIDSKIIVEAPKQYKVEIIDKKIKISETTTTKTRSRKGSSTSTYTTSKTISDTDIKTNNLSPKIIENADGSKVRTSYSFYIYVKKWWEGSDKSDIGIEVEKNTFDNLKRKQIVYIKSNKGCFGIRHIVRDNEFLKVVEENNIGETTY